MSWLGGKKLRSLEHASDLEFLRGTLESEVFERTPRSHLALWLMLAVVVSFLAWASWARVDEVTKADGHVVADGREQQVASLEGGILAKMLVREGEVVEAGQALAQIDPLRFASQQNEGEAKRIGTRAAVARLTAEVNGTPLSFPKDLENAPPAILAAERESYQARRRALDEAVAGSRKSLKMLETELAMSERLASQGLMSEVEILRLKRQSIELNAQIDERTNRYRQEATADLARLKSDLAQQDQQAVVRQDVLQRTLLKSPVRGVVKAIKYNTPGGVVPAGQPALEILPMGPRVLVDARVKASQIGFIKVGQHATVKLATYDYTIYGALEGQVEFISPDAVVEDGKPTPPDGPSYRVIIATHGRAMAAGGKPLAVLPGMTASVEIRTGDRSVLDFIARPMLKSREALRER